MHFTAEWAVLLAVGVSLFLVERYNRRRASVERFDPTSVRNYLLSDIAMGLAPRPILWIHVPYERNSRHWDSFMSRATHELNQPYLELTARALFRHCRDSFTVCVYDDQSFATLLPDWKVDLAKVSDPLLPTLRQLGQFKLLHTYGGFVCPMSFLCMRDLHSLYELGTQHQRFFACEALDRSVSATTHPFRVSAAMCGAPKQCPVVAELCQYVETLLSTDYTCEAAFLGQVDRWCAKQVASGRANRIDGTLVGTKTATNAPVLLDDLLSDHHVSLYAEAYGLWIPARELLSRTAFGWFVRASHRQIVDSNTVLGHYFVLSLHDAEETEREEREKEDGEERRSLSANFRRARDWISFWRVPSGAPVWGLQPTHLGDRVPRL